MSVSEASSALGRPHGQDQVVEHRAAGLVGLEFRDTGDTGDGQMTLAGHAAVFEKLSLPLYDRSYGEFQERIARGAFDAVLSRNPDVHLVIGHDMTRVLARTASKTLELRDDPAGLRMFARIDPNLSFAKDLRIQMQRGDVNQASFAFTVAKDEWLITESADGGEKVTRTITEIGELFDVSVVAQGAYPQTDANIRSLLEDAASHGRLAVRATDLPHRSAPKAEGEQDSRDGGPSGSTLRKRRAVQMRQRLALITRDAFMVMPPMEPMEPDETLGALVADAIEGLSCLLSHGFDLSMPSDADESMTIQDEIVECISVLAGVLGDPTIGVMDPMAPDPMMTGMDGMA